MGASALGSFWFPEAVPGSNRQGPSAGAAILIALLPPRVENPWVWEEILPQS